MPWYFVLGFVPSLALNPLYRHWATSRGYVERPQNDRWHQKETAAVGGAAIATALLIGFPFLEPLREAWVVMLCAGAMFVLGLADDIRSLTPGAKLVGQIVLASALLFFGYRLGWSESLTLDTMLTLLWIVGITNAFNLLDNMDGLCGGVALVAGFAMLAGFLTASDIPAEAAFVAVLLGAIAGFLVYNVHPATVFLGDSGSLLLGVSLAVLALHSGPGLEPQSNIVAVVAVPVFVLLIPIFDATLVTVTRILSGRSPAQGGKDHSSHRLVAIGLSEGHAVAVLWVLAAIGGLLGFVLDGFSPAWAGLAAALYLVAIAIFAVYLAQVEAPADDDTDPVLVQTGRFTPLISNLMYKRRLAEILLDVSLVSIAYYAAYRLRFEEDEEFAAFFPSFVRSLPLVLGLQISALFAVGAYRGVWKRFGLMDGVVFAKSVLIGTVLIVTSVTYLDRFELYSRGVFVIYGALLTLLLLTSRASFKLIDEFMQRRLHAGERLVIYGAGSGGVTAVRELVGQPGQPFRMMGFIDDDPDKHRTRFHGYPVLGTFGELERLIAHREVDRIVIGMRMIDTTRVFRIEELCQEHGVRLSRLHVDLRHLVTVD